MFYKRKALTLVELIISITIFSMLALVIVNVSYNAVKTQNIIKTELQVYGQMKLTMDFIEAQVRNSIYVYIPENNQNVILTIHAYDKSLPSTEIDHDFIFKKHNYDDEYKLFFGGPSNGLTKYIDDLTIRLDEQNKVIIVEACYTIKDSKKIKLSRNIDVSNKTR